MTMRNTRISIATAMFALFGLILAAPAQEKKSNAAPAAAPKASPPAHPQPAPPVAKPTSVRPMPPKGQPAPAAHPAGDIPAPTVTLKPGEVPAIKFDTPIYDFGRIRAGQDVVHDFWFTNTGTGPLELLRVRPSCGCTQAGAHDKIVQPGQTGKIPIKMATGHAAGPVNKTVMVNTNVTGEGSSVTLQIKGEVWQPIQTTPTSASFGRLTAESMKSATLERKLTIVNNTEDKANLTNVKSSSASFKGTVRELEAGKKFELTVAVVPPLSSGVVSGNIEIDTGVKDMPKLQIPVNAYVTADVEVTPNQLTLPTNRPAAMQRQFFVRNNSSTSMKVSDLKSTNDKLKVSILETQPVGMAYRISLDVPADYQIPPGGDKITFKTDNANMPSIVIPIVAAPAPPNISAQFKPALTPSAAPGAAPAGKPTPASPVGASTGAKK